MTPKSDLTLDLGLGLGLGLDLHFAVWISVLQSTFRIRVRKYACLLGLEPWIGLVN